MSLRCIAWVTLATALLVSNAAHAQAPAREVRHQRQLWVGYMTQLRLTDRFGLWNDAHLVPGGFYVLRTGLTVHAHERVAVTAGYAFLGLPVGSLTPDLKRTEHRPWGQIVYSAHLGERWRIQQRFRYDARFRRNLDEGGLAPGYALTNRVRFMLNFRRDLTRLRFGPMLPYFTFGNEVLLNFGRRVVYNHLDQNRVSAALGVTYRGLSVQLGYMHRFVQLEAGNRFVANHTLTLWVFHAIDARRPAERAAPVEQEEESPFGGV
ncbi:MAG: DUF2490 domain-containing protein [Myxococcales bacterium]|nr:DUF2490 domain-containing protein [Myxococcales bacterium]